jgi:LacI family transcriptional regulator
MYIMRDHINKPSFMTLPITIAEIARNAGVGTATVDRVINGRSGVNAETERKVREAIQALGTPTVSRGRPTTRRNFKFAYVMPEGASHFFGQLERHIAQTAGDFRHQHITEVTYRFNADDPAKFAAELAGVADCDAIALVAPDLPAIKLAINEHVRAGVHIVTLFSDVAGSMRHAFVGADNRASGRTAGLLLARMAQAPKRKKLLLISPTTRMSSEIERRIGFVQVVEERFNRLEIVRTSDLPLDETAAFAALQSYLAANIDMAQVAGVYVVGGSTKAVVEALQVERAAQAVPVVAHDFTAEHQAMLIDSRLAYVLHQDVRYSILNAARVLRGLCDNVRGAINVVQPRVEILTAENLH